MGWYINNRELHPETLTTDSRYCPVLIWANYWRISKNRAISWEQEVVEQQWISVNISQTSMAKVAQGLVLHQLVSNIQKILQFAMLGNKD